MSTQTRSEDATRTPSAGMVEMKLEVVVVPVSAVDRGKRLYNGWLLQEIKTRLPGRCDRARPTED